MSKLHHLVQRNERVNWQVAPAEWEIANYDEPKVRYRRYVEDFLKEMTASKLRKKTFVTISTNVLCADIPSSRENVEPIDRDLYFPLEIALTKWSVSESARPQEKRTMKTQVWMINPGPPPPNCNSYARIHSKNHKIDYSNIEATKDTYLDSDLVKVYKEINSMLTPDKTVFSVQLRNCRQDLGALKWLNRAVDYKMNPVKVLSLEDLYVVLIRKLIPDEQLKKSIGQGIARYRMEFSSNTYDGKYKCQYHQNAVRENEDNDTQYCARAVAFCYTNILLDDVKYFTDILADDYQDQQPESNPTSAPEKISSAGLTDSTS